MEENKNLKKYTRKVTGAERFFSHAPFSTVTMVARIKGRVTENMLRLAVTKAQQRHVLLRTRIHDPQNGELWFTTEDAQDIPIEVVPRKAENDWIELHKEGAKKPYEFENRPAIRFILVQSPQVSELIILCHHMICDGMSLAYLARDLMEFMGKPTADAESISDLEPISLDNLPGDVAPSGLIKYFINKINQKWHAEIVYFNQADYEALNTAYWENYHHNILPVELSVAETSALVARCRAEKVTVNTALISAFSGAQKMIVSEKPHHAKTVSAANLRDRLPTSPGEAIGYYALGMEVNFKYNLKKGFWDNARKYHKKITANTSNKKVFGDLPTFLLMDSNIYEALSFKKLGALVNPDSPSYEKLKGFSTREDVVVGLLKRAKMETLDSKLMGNAITNLGRMDIPSTYGDLELDRLIMQPGGAFPLVHVDMVLGVVTCAGKLSLVVEYAEEAVDTATMEKITEKAMGLLQ